MLSNEAEDSTTTRGDLLPAGLRFSLRCSSTSLSSTGVKQVGAEPPSTAGHRQTTTYWSTKTPDRCASPCNAPTPYPSRSLLLAAPSQEELSVPLFSSFEAIAFVLRYQKQGVPLELGPSITDLAVGNVYICTPKSHPTTSPPPHLT